MERGGQGLICYVWGDKCPPNTPAPTTPQLPPPPQLSSVYWNPSSLIWGTCYTSEVPKWSRIV